MKGAVKKKAQDLAPGDMLVIGGAAYKVATVRSRSSKEVEIRTVGGSYPIVLNKAGTEMVLERKGWASERAPAGDARVRLLRPPRGVPRGGGSEGPAARVPDRESLRRARRRPQHERRGGGVMEELYLVTWEIDIEASSAEEAAQKALVIQRTRESIATMFRVRRSDAHEGVDVDLGYAPNGYTADESEVEEAGELVSTHTRTYRTGPTGD